MTEPIEAEIVDDDVTFRFDIDNTGVNLEVGVWNLSLAIKVVWDAVVRGLNLLKSVWNGILAMMAGHTIPDFSF